MRYRSSAILAVGVALSGAAYSQAFWSGSSYGDTLDQVRAKVAATIVTTSENTARAAGYVEMASTAISLAGEPFNVFFYFTPGGLDRVILVAAALSTKEQADATFDVLIKAMREKYKSVSETEDLGRAVAEDKPFWMQWRSGDTDIWLVPQHHEHPLMVAYELSDDAKSRAAKARARKSDPKVEAKKL